MKKIYSAIYVSIAVAFISKLMSLVFCSSDTVLHGKIVRPPANMKPLILKFENNEFYIPGIIPLSCVEGHAINDAWALADREGIRPKFHGAYRENTPEARKRTPGYLTDRYKEGARAIVTKYDGIVLD